MNNKFILHDAGSRAILALPRNSAVGQFLHHHVLDTRLTSTSVSCWEKAIANMVVKVESEDRLVYDGRYCWIDNNLVMSDSINNHYNHERRKQAKYLNKGFEFVTSSLNHQTLDIASTGYFLTLDDLKLFPDLTELIPSLMDAVDLSFEEAQHQLIIERQSLLNIYKYRKNAIWRHCKLLQGVVTDADYETWKCNVRTKSGGIGLI